MARTFFNKLLDYIGLEETDMEESELLDEEIYPDERAQDDNIVNINRARGERSKVVSMPPPASAPPNKMIIYQPISYEDTQNIIDNLKSRKPVIVNMEELEIECAQRILDFMAGAIYALNGTIHKISRGIFVVAPNNFGVVSNDEEAF